MTPLQQLIVSIWALLPSLIPHFFAVWAVAAGVVVANLAIDAYKGELMPLRRSLAQGLWVGSVLTLFVILTEARDKGLIAPDSFAGMVIGSLAVSFSLMQLRARRTG